MTLSLPLEGEHRQLILARCPSQAGRVPTRCRPAPRRARPARTNSAASFVLEAMDAPRKPHSGLPIPPPLATTPQCRNARESPASRCRTPLATSSRHRWAPRFLKGSRPRLAASRLPGVLQPGDGLVDPQVAIRPAELRVDLVLPQLGGLPQSLWFFHLAVPRSPFLLTPPAFRSPPVPRSLGLDIYHITNYISNVEYITCQRRR